MYEEIINLVAGFLGVCGRAVILYGGSIGSNLNARKGGVETEYQL